MPDNKLEELRKSTLVNLAGKTKAEVDELCAEAALKLVEALAIVESISTAIAWYHGSIKLLSNTLVSFHPELTAEAKSVTDVSDRLAKAFELPSSKDTSSDQVQP